MRHLEVLARARAAAEARMTETVKIGITERRTDPTTRKATEVIADPPRYEGPGRIKYDSLATSSRDVPGQPTQEQSPHLSIPADAPSCAEGETVHVMASLADGSLVGRRYKITGAPQAGQTSSHRYPLIELS